VRIKKLKAEITDCYNQSRLESVNDFLLKLNTQIKIEVRNNQHYIKLKDFKAKELEKRTVSLAKGRIELLLLHIIWLRYHMLKMEMGKER
jgi:hypothetical protein